MFRSMLCLAVLLTACEADAPPEPQVAEKRQNVIGGGFTRTQVAGDVYHYEFVIPVGSGPNASLHLHRVVRERAPGIPRRSEKVVLATHGDFATFVTNFLPMHGNPSSAAPSLALWLAQHDVDVWGLDRRGYRTPEVGTDFSDFDAMGIVQGLGDIRVALAFLRGIRILTDASLAQVTLMGFSRGGQLTYLYASDEATRPAWQRHVKGIVPIDMVASFSAADEAQRQFACDSAVAEYDILAEGVVDVDNATYTLPTGRLALSAPYELSPYFPPQFNVTNRDWLLSFVGETYYYFPGTPAYHLLAPVLDPDTQFVIGLSQTSEDAAAKWIAGGAPHQPMRESADADALLCGDAPLPADLPLSRITVPVFLLAAAGGYGEAAVDATTRVASTDVTALVVRQFPVGRETEDFGHADLLFAPEAESLAWQPLLTWLRAH